jgi:hypothetical protein
LTYRAGWIAVGVNHDLLVGTNVSFGSLGCKALDVGRRNEGTVGLAQRSGDNSRRCKLPTRGRIPMEEERLTIPARRIEGAGRHVYQVNVVFADAKCRILQNGGSAG